MPIVLYYMSLSPYCRSVLLGARAVGVTLELRTIDIRVGEQLKPDFIAINPQHTVPTLVDGDLVLWESRAILTYLVGRYGKDKSLYPEDVMVRAEVDSLLYFECGTLVPRWRAVVHPVLKDGKPRPCQASLEKFHEGLGWLEISLSKHKGKFAAGTEKLTVADIALVASVSTYEAGGFFKSEMYPVTGAWLERCKQTIPDYQELNGDSATKFGNWIQSKIQK